MMAGKINNRILRFKNDHYDKFGIFILTDDKPVETIESEYKDAEQCSIFTFPYTSSGVSHVTLSTIKQGRVFSLITTNDDDAVAPDSFFRTIKSSRSVFEQKDHYTTGLTAACEVTSKFGEKTSLHALVMTSVQRNKSKLYPLVATKDPVTKETLKIELIKKEANVKSMEVDKSEDDDMPFHSF